MSRDAQVTARFRDRAQAEEAIASLRHMGVSAEQIRIADGTGVRVAAMGRTEAEDDAVASRLTGAFLGGAVFGTLIGAVCGAIAGFLLFEPFSLPWWGLFLAAGFGGGGW